MNEQVAEDKSATVSEAREPHYVLWSVLPSCCLREESDWRHRLVSGSTGLLLVWVRAQPCLCAFVWHRKHYSGEQLWDKLFKMAPGGAGVGFVKNGTLEVNLKEQEGTFYGDEIKTRLGERQEGCSSHWLQCVESHWD